MRKSYSYLVVVLFLTTFLASIALGAAGSFTSDDFNGYVLKRPLWTWADPAGGSGLSLSGVNSGNAMLSITVPAGTSHDIYTDGYNGARIVQTCTNTDFRIEASFASLLRTTGNPAAYDIQGIVVEQDASHLIRFDLDSGDPDSVRLVAIVFDGGFASPTNKIFKFITGYANQPTFLRVVRTGNTWTVSYSADGSSYTTGGSFTQTFTITKVGPWAGNAGGTPREWTSIVDYFMNMDSPISPEDGSTSVLDNQAPYIHNIQTLKAQNAILVTWNTDAQADGGVDFGTTTSYGDNTGHLDLRYSHFAELGGLTPSTQYHFKISGRTAAGPLAATGDNVASTTAAAGVDLASYSDDFNAPVLDASLWSASNPRGDASFTQASNRLSIVVPGGIAHEIYGVNTAPKIMQSVGDQDMQITARFLSGVANVGPAYQIQGMVFEQDSLNQLRVDFSNSGTGTQLLAIGFVNGLSNSISYLGSDVASFGAPLYLRVSRSGALWIVEYSSNGSSWSTLGTFYHIMNVQRFGVWAGNAGVSPPAFTALVDWFKAALPAKPALLTPVNGAPSVLLQPALVWDTTAAATSYRVQVATDTNFTSVFQDDSSLTSPTKQMSGMLNSTKYFWRTRGKNANGIGKFSTISSFTTAAQPPATPALLSPADNAVDQDTASTVRWSKSTGATAYKLQIATDPGFASGVFLNDSTIVDTTRQLHGLALNTKYYWHVAAKNTGGSSAFTATRNFTTITGVPTAPTLLFPAAAAVDQPVALTLRWSRTTPASLTFRVQVSTDPTFATAILVDDSTLTDTTRALSGLLNSTKYYWRVRGKNNGGIGAFSGSRDFTTIVAIPSATVLMSPPNGTTEQPTSMSLIWHKTTGAASYHIQLATDSTFAGGFIVNDSTVTDTTRSVGGLSFNVKYFWRVNAKNVGGTGPYSSVWNFKTLTQDPSVPVQLAPLNGSTGLATTVAVRWSRPPGATSFHFQFGTDSSFATTIIDDPAMTDTSRSLTGLTFLTKYFWRVNADNIGGTSPWSGAWSFATGVPLPSAVILVSPGHLSQLGSTSARLIWRKSTPLVNKYWVQLAIDSLFTFSVIDSTISDSTKVLTGLIDKQWYFWRVRAANPGGWGAYSEVRKFQYVILGVDDVERPLPTDFALKQNYPNPFNPSTEIAFELPKESQVRIEIYSLLGQLLGTVMNERRQAGYHTVRFNASDLPTGLYLYRLTAGEKTFTRKMMLVK
jgi:hypothetical protein